MRRFLAPALTLIAAMVMSKAAMAQVVPFRPGPASATIGDVHRYEMDRLRARSDANADLARQQQSNTRLTIQDLQSARRSAPIQPFYRAPRSLEEERALRESATRRRERLSRDVGQIDDWLNRPAPDRQPD